MPYWNDNIAKDILKGRQVLVVAHGNSLRSIVKYLDNVSEKGIAIYKSLDILELNIPTSVPLVYEFDANFRSLGSYYLGDQDEIRRKMQAVAS